MFRFFESLVPRALTPPRDAEPAGPPPGLVAFYWHFVRQTRGLYLAMLATGLGVALIDTTIPVFIGKLVGLMTATDRNAALLAQWPLLAGMAALVLFGRPLMMASDSLVRNNAVIPGVTTLIRWQSHWHVIRQSWPFFQNDFAGPHRQPGDEHRARAARERGLEHPRDLVHHRLRAGGARADAVLATRGWPRPRCCGWPATSRSCATSSRGCATSPGSAPRRARGLMGSIVDTYTNFLDGQALRPRARRGRLRARQALDEHRDRIAAHMRMTTRFMFTLHCLNAVLVVGTATVGVALWARGAVEPGDRRDRIAAGLADLQHGGLGVVGGERHLREHRHRAGGHGDDRGAAHARRPRRRPAAGGLARRDPLRARALRLRTARARRRRGDRRPHAHASRRARGSVSSAAPARASRRWSPAAAFPRRRGRAHPDRRTGPARGHPGEPARGDRHGHPGHLAAAPVDRREHPLRPARRQRRPGRGGRAPGARARVHPGAARLGGPPSATRPGSASAA